MFIFFSAPSTKQGFVVSKTVYLKQLLSNEHMSFTESYVKRKIVKTTKHKVHTFV